MSSTPNATFEHAVQDTNRLLNEISSELGHPDIKVAYHALRGTLFALRDRLPPDEALDLSAQLPLLVRGIFFEGYRLAGKPEKMDRDAFLERVALEINMVRPANTLDATRAVLAVLASRISEGEWNQVRRAMPEDIRPLFQNLPLHEYEKSTYA